MVSPDTLEFSIIIFDNSFSLKLSIDEIVPIVSLVKMGFVSIVAGVTSPWGFLIRSIIILTSSSLFGPSVVEIIVSLLFILPIDPSGPMINLSLPGKLTKSFKLKVSFK